MKTILVLLFTSLGLVGLGQCVDFMGTPAPCPTASDSMEIYQNALKVYQFYHHNKTYKTMRSTRIRTADDVSKMYKRMLESRKMYFTLRSDRRTQNRSGSGSFVQSIGYKDIPYERYFNQINAHRFRQRDLENQIINGESPFTLYDDRVAPIVINEYKCLDSSSRYFGDIVNIPMYIPVVVKPYSLLSDAELSERNEILGIETEIKQPVEAENKSITPMSAIQRNKGVPVYYYNAYGSGSIVGFLHNRTIHRICRNEYHSFAMPRFARELLDNEEELNRWVKSQFGGRYQLNQR